MAETARLRSPSATMAAFWPRVATLPNRLSAPTDIAPLVVLRIGFGLMMALSVVRFIARGWVESLYLAPTFHFTYLGFGWVQPLPPAGMALVFGLLLLSALAIAAGLLYRLSMATFFVLFTYVELLEKASYLNHYYFISVLSFLLLFLPLNGALSLDARLGWTPRQATVPRWMISAVRLQLSLVYVFAGLAKVNPDWLFEALPLRIWLQARTATPLIGPLFDQVWLAYAMSWGGLLFDCTIPLWLSWRKTRLLAYSAVIVFHGLTGLLFNIGMFPWIMIVCTLVFFDWRLPQKARMGISAEGRPPARWLPWLIGAFLLVQLLLPLRHWLYPGDVNWTEEGFRFAWRVMLVEKTGHATFFVRDPASGREWTVFPSEYLTPLQESEMVSQPDMLLQFAHFLQDEFGSNTQVRAEAYVSWNGRDSHLLVDPCVDLAAQPNTLAASLQPRSWIVREPTLRQKACAH